MKLIFVRHGDPNYELNCLTEVGHRQAELVAPRVAAYAPKAIFSSKFGRAVETAQPAARLLGQEIQILDFLHEISTGPGEIPPEDRMKYAPWAASRKLAIEQGVDLHAYDYSDFIAWKGTRLPENHDRVVSGFDAWMKDLGFEREGLWYRCTKQNDDTYAVFSHAGALSCVFAHLWNMPAFEFFAQTDMSVTGMTEVDFCGAVGERVLPRFQTYNDHAHLEGTGYVEGESVRTK